MAPGTRCRPSPNASDPRGSAPDPEKAQVKDYIGRVVDDSPDPAKGITTTDIVKGNLQKLPPPERLTVLDGLVKQIPKIKGIQEQVRDHKANLRRGERRDEQMAYLDKTWGGRQNWAHPTYMPRITETISISTTAPLTTVTRLAVQHRISLTSLWQPGGELHDAAFAYGEHVLTKDKAGAALRAFKLRLRNSQIPEVDDSDGHDDPESESEQEHASKRSKYSIVERSPSVESGRRYTPAFKHHDSLFSPEQDVHRDDDDCFVSLLASSSDDVSARPPNHSISPIHRHTVNAPSRHWQDPPSSPSPIVNDTIPVDDYQLKTALVDNQSISQLARQQLQDSDAWLTGDVMDLLMQHITSTSKDPAAKVVNPLYIQIENNQKSHQPPPGFTRFCASNEVIYIPLHHRSQGRHWSLAVLRPNQDHIEHYDSMHSRTREIRIQSCFQRMLGSDTLSLARMHCPQQADSVNCGVFAVCFLGFLLNSLRFPTSLDPSAARQKLLNLLPDPPREQPRPVASTTENVAPSSHMPMESVGIQVPESATTPDISTTRRTPARALREIPQVRQRITELENEIESLSTRLVPLIERKAVFGLVPAALMEMERVLSRAQPFDTSGSFWRSEEEAHRATDLLSTYRAVENLASLDPRHSADEVAAVQEKLDNARVELQEARHVFKKLANVNLADALLLLQESRRGE